MYNISIELDPKAFNQFMLNGVHQLETQLPITLGEYLNDLKLYTNPNVPLDKGTLENSGTTEVHSSGFTIEGTLKYSATGKNGYDYAEIQNRRCDYKHPKRGKCHYINDTVTEREPLLTHYVLEDIKRCFTY